MSRQTPFQFPWLLSEEEQQVHDDKESVSKLSWTHVKVSQSPPKKYLGEGSVAATGLFTRASSEGGESLHTWGDTRPFLALFRMLEARSES